MTNLRSLEITSRIGCANACAFCPQKLLVQLYLKQPKPLRKIVLSFDAFKKCLKTVPKDVRIDFSGMAEPWLNNNCTQMILYAYNKGYRRMTIFTTGVGMSTGDVQKIKHIPFEYFCLHLADNKGYAKINVNKEYLNIVKKIKNAGFVNFHCMALGGKPHPKVKSLFKGLLVDFPLVSRAGNLPSFPKINKTGPITCCWPEKVYHNVLLPNGNVIFCCNDYGMTHILGNLLNDKYKDLFKGKAFKNILRLLKSEKNGDILCRHCEHAIEDKSSQKQPSNFPNKLIKIIKSLLQ